MQDPKNRQKFAICASLHNFVTLYFSQLRHVSTIGKNLLNSNISSRCPHNTANFRPLKAKLCWRVWGNPANFNRFRSLASLLHWRRSSEANQTLHDVKPPPGLVSYIYIFGAFAPWQNFAMCKIHFVSKSCILQYWQQYCTVHDQWASAKLCCNVQGMELQNFRRWHHLYLAGWPSRWASAHILVEHDLNTLSTNIINDFGKNPIKKYSN